MTQTIGNALDILFADIAAKKDADIDKSYSASLIKAGPKKCAKKLGEEAVELAIALSAGDAEEIKNEAADVLYHFAAAIIASNIDPKTIAQVLEKRRGVSGHEEKANRPK